MPANHSDCRYATCGGSGAGIRYTTIVKLPNFSYSDNLPLSRVKTNAGAQIPVAVLSSLNWQVSYQNGPMSGVFPRPHHPVKFVSASNICEAAPVSESRHKTL